jgi:hypothetical protein
MTPEEKLLHDIFDNHELAEMRGDSVEASKTHLHDVGIEPPELEHGTYFQGLPWSYYMIGILQSHAPNGPAQQLVAQVYSDMKADNFSENQMQSELAGLLKDGLDYGNWIWVLNPLPEAEIELTPREVQQIRGIVDE